MAPRLAVLSTAKNTKTKKRCETGNKTCRGKKAGVN